MSNVSDLLRSELRESLRPPIDVMLDPSLLASEYTLDRLANSTVVRAQTQTTLDSFPSKPKVGALYVPASFRRLIDRREQFDVQKTEAWNFFRGKADGAYREEILDLLDRNDVKGFEADDSAFTSVNWERSLGDPQRNERLVAVLVEELTFLAEGGVLVSRSPDSLSVLRDTGVPTVDIGRAELAPTTRSTLEDIGYRNPASLVAFGISSVPEAVDALAGDLLSSHVDLLLYRIGN